MWQNFDMDVAKIWTPMIWWEGYEKLFWDENLSK